MAADKKNPKFVQISNSCTYNHKDGAIARDILALDAEGDVWLYEWAKSRKEKGGWRRLSTIKKSGWAAPVSTTSPLAV
jgi:hypothetical protein